MQSSTSWLKRFITSSGSASMGVCTMFCTREKIVIWVFLEVQEINFLGPLKVNINIVYFHMNIFNFMNKFFKICDFFWNILLHHTPSNSNDIFDWFTLFDKRTMQIKLTAALLKKPANLLKRHKETNAQKIFCELPKE